MFVILRMTIHNAVCTMLIKVYRVSYNWAVVIIVYSTIARMTFSSLCRSIIFSSQEKQAIVIGPARSCGGCSITANSQ